MCCGFSRLTPSTRRRAPPIAEPSFMKRSANSPKNMRMHCPRCRACADRTRQEAFRAAQGLRGGARASGGRAFSASPGGSKVGSASAAVARPKYLPKCRGNMRSHLVKPNFSSPRVRIASSGAPTAATRSSITKQVSRRPSSQVRSGLAPSSHWKRPSCAMAVSGNPCRRVGVGNRLCAAEGWRSAG